MQELSSNAALAGSIVIMWLISPQGAVTKAFVKESTLKNSNVENCIKNSILNWRFPTPKGGGLVTVEYHIEFGTNDESPIKIGTDHN